jgi:hypothetical protein
VFRSNPRLKKGPYGNVFISSLYLPLLLTEQRGTVPAYSILLLHGPIPIVRDFPQKRQAEQNCKSIHEETGGKRHGEMRMIKDGLSRGRSLRQ